VCGYVETTVTRTGSYDTIFWLQVKRKLQLSRKYTSLAAKGDQEEEDSITYRRLENSGLQRYNVWLVLIVYLHVVHVHVCTYNCVMCS